MPCAFVFALERAGNSMAARMAIIAITTSNSIKVNAEKRVPRKKTLSSNDVPAWGFE
jgi:hypothetical protein